LELRTLSTEDEVAQTAQKIDETHDSVVRLETVVHKLEEDVKGGNAQQRQTNQKIIDKLTSIEVIVRSNN
jgi:phage shock protein A